MAIFIRTGANGSYKSAYVAYFVILEALKAGRVVVTNMQGFETLDVIEKRFKPLHIGDNNATCFQCF